MDAYGKSNGTDATGSLDFRSKVWDTNLILFVIGVATLAALALIVLVVCIIYSKDRMRSDVLEIEMPAV